MYAHKETGCKGTKKIPYMQIYMGKSFENVDFAREMRGFGEYRTKKEEKKSAATAVYNLIENKNINNTIIAFSILYVTKKVREKSLNWISTSRTPNLHSV
jgi:hypothetical protein